MLRIRANLHTAGAHGCESSAQAVVTVSAQAVCMYIYACPAALKAIIAIVCSREL